MSNEDPYKVYYIAETGTPNVKVGVAADPHKRLRELQTGNPRQLILRAVIPGFSHLDAALAAERELHSKYEHYRLRGEWFVDADGEIFDFFKVTGTLVTSNRKAGRPRKNTRKSFSDSYVALHPRVERKFNDLIKQVGLVEATRHLNLSRVLSVSRMEADALRALGETRINKALAFEATARAVSNGDWNNPELN